MAVEQSSSSPEGHLNLAREIHSQVEDIFDFSSVDKSKLPYAIPTGDTLMVDEAQVLVTEMTVKPDGSLESGEPIANIIHDRAILDIVNTLPPSAREAFVVEGVVSSDPAIRLKLIKEVMRNIKQNGIEDFSRNITTSHNWNASEVLTSLQVLAVRYAHEATTGVSAGEEEIGGEVRSVQKKTHTLKLPASYIPGRNSVALDTNNETSLYNVSSSSRIENKHGMKATFADARASVMMHLKEGRTDTAFSSAMETFSNMDNLSEETQVAIARRLRLAINRKIREIQEGPQDVESQALAQNLNALAPLLVEDPVTRKAQGVDTAAIKEGMQLLFPASTLEQQLKTPATRDQALKQLSQEFVDWGHVVFGREYQKAVNTDLRMGVAIMDLALPPAERLKRIQLEQQIHRLQQGLEGQDAQRISQYREEMLKMSTEGQTPSEEQQKTHQILQRLTAMNPEVVAAKKELEELRARERKLVLCAFNVQTEDGSAVIDEKTLSAEDLALVKQIREHTNYTFVDHQSNTPADAATVTLLSTRDMLLDIGIDARDTNLVDIYRALNTTSGNKADYEEIVTRYLKIDPTYPEFDSIIAILKDTRRIDKALAGTGRSRDSIHMGGDELLMGLKGLYFMDQNMQLEETSKKLDVMSVTGSGAGTQIRDSVDIFRIVQGTDNADELAQAFEAAMNPAEIQKPQEVSPDNKAQDLTAGGAEEQQTPGEPAPAEKTSGEPDAAPPSDELPKNEEPEAEKLAYPEREKVLKTLAKRVYDRFVEDTPDVEEGIKTRVLAKIREKLRNADGPITLDNLEELTKNEWDFAEVLAELEYLPKLPATVKDKREPIRFMFRTDEETGEQLILVSPEKNSRVIILGPDAGSILNPPVLDDIHPDNYQWELAVLEANEKSNNPKSTQRSEIDIRTSGISIISIDTRMKIRASDETRIQPLALPAEYNRRNEQRLYFRNQEITSYTYSELGNFELDNRGVYRVKQVSKKLDTNNQPYNNEVVSLELGMVLNRKGFVVEHNKNIPVYSAKIISGDEEFYVAIKKDTEKNKVTYSVIGSVPPEKLAELEEVCKKMFTNTSGENRKIVVKAESSALPDTGDQDIEGDYTSEKNRPLPIEEGEVSEKVVKPTVSSETQRSFLSAFPGWTQAPDGFYYRDNGENLLGFREISSRVEMAGKENPVHAMDIEFNIEGKKRILHVLHLGNGQFRIANPGVDDGYRNGVMHLLEGLYEDKQAEALAKRYEASSEKQAPRAEQLQPKQAEAQQQAQPAPAEQAPQIAVAEATVTGEQVAPKEHPEIATMFPDWQHGEDGFMYQQNGDNQFGFRISIPNAKSSSPLSQTNLIIGDFSFAGKPVRATITGIRSGELKIITGKDTITEQEEQILRDFIEQYFASRTTHTERKQPKKAGPDEIISIENASDLPTIDMDSLTEGFEDKPDGFKHQVITSNGLTVPVDIKYSDARRARSGNLVQDIKLRLNGVDIEGITLTIDERRTVTKKDSSEKIPNRNYGKVVLYTHEAPRTRELIKEVLAAVMKLDMDQVVVRGDKKKEESDGVPKPKTFGLERKIVNAPAVEKRRTKDTRPAPVVEEAAAVAPATSANEGTTIEGAKLEATEQAAPPAPEPATAAAAEPAPSTPETPVQSAEARFPNMVEGDSPKKRELSRHIGSTIWELLDKDEYISLTPSIHKILRTHATELGMTVPKIQEVDDTYLSNLNTEQWAFILSKLISEDGDAKMEVLEVRDATNKDHVVIRIDISGPRTDGKIINMLDAGANAGADRHHIALLGTESMGQGAHGFTLSEVAHIGHLGVGFSTFGSIRSVTESLLSDCSVQHIRSSGGSTRLRNSTLGLIEHAQELVVEYTNVDLDREQNVGELRSTEDLKIKSIHDVPARAVIGDVSQQITLENAEVLIFSDTMPQIKSTGENRIGYVSRNLNDEKAHMRRIMQQFKPDTLHSITVQGNLAEMDITTLLPEGVQTDLYPIAINNRLYLVVETDLVGATGKTGQKGRALVEVNRTNFSDEEQFVFKLVKIQEI